MKTAKGLHLWLANFDPWGTTTIQVTTRLRAPQLAIKRAQQAAREQGINGSLIKLQYAGTLDA